MLKIRNNPIDILLSICECNYKETADKIQEIAFAQVEEGYAVTVFSDDGIYIYISSFIGEEKDEPITFEVATELLAHELAHAICGENEGHGKLWENTFDRLNKLYLEHVESKIKICVQEEE